LIEQNNPSLSLQHQCELLSIFRSGVYYKPRPANSRKNSIREVIISKLKEYPDLSIRKMTDELQKEGYQVGRKLVTSIYLELGAKK